jgi:hypothetical protein
VNLDHGGDIQDEDCLSGTVIRMTRALPGTAARVQTMESDLMLTETVARLSDRIDFSESISIVLNGELHAISDDSVGVRVRVADVRRTLGPSTRFSPEIQSGFQCYCQSIASVDLYQQKTLTVPFKLKRLLSFDRTLISQVVEFALFPRSLKLNETEFCEQRVALRKFHFAQLDVVAIRIPRSFGAVCGEKPLRYVRLSYLLSLGFESLQASGRLDAELAAAMAPELEMLQASEALSDDDESWLDATAPLPRGCEEIGAERPERVATFVSEISGFDSEADIFEAKLMHFLSESELSESIEEEEEEEADEVLGALDSMDRQLF